MVGLVGPKSGETGLANGFTLRYYSSIVINGCFNGKVVRRFQSPSGSLWEEIA